MKKVQGLDRRRRGEHAVIRSSLRIARPRRLVVLAIAALIPALAGCEAGYNAPTQQWHQPTDGSAAVHNNISISNAFVLGAPLSQKIPAGQSAGVFLALYNDGSSDALVSIAAPGTARSVTLPGGSVPLASQQSVRLTGPAPEVVLQGLTRPLTGGSTVRLVMVFQNAGALSLVLPVMPQAQYYSTFSPPPSPSPSPSATPSASPSP
jgi:copper(I)-binding protein